MCLAAHPDDEDGAGLAFYGRLRGMKTYNLLFTRGEGGQNETGSELYEDLGALRTRETMEAAKILSTEAYFLGYPDFGFSKTAKETFKKWGDKDGVVARLVFFIRALKPDVIITNHDTVTTKPNRQHGNHQAVGISAYEAFERAADPTFHPEQLKDGITVWQAKKLFCRVLRTESSANNSSLVELDVKQRDSIRTSIEQIALEALHKHRSQGLGNISLAAMPESFRRHRYRLIRSDRQYAFDNNDLFSGLAPSSRTLALIKNAPTDSISPIRIVVSPNYLPFELPEETTQPQIHRTIAFSILKRFPGTINATIDVHGKNTLTILSHKNLSLVNDKYIDTLGIIFRKNQLVPDEQLAIEVRQMEHDRISDTAMAHDVVTFKSVPADYEHGALVGLVKTYDNTLEDIFNSFHVKYRLLDSTRLAKGDLRSYTAIVLDLRTFEFRTDAVQYANRLLEYAREGGNIICFYHKPNDWNGKGYAPYPIVLSAERVTQEDAPVAALKPNHPLLSSPNTLTPEDWMGWVQERSIYLPTDDTAKTSARYERLLAMSDEDEQQPSTSLLWANAGRGTYTYVSLVLYRQLRVLNTGAVKLLLNMISQPRH